METSQCPGGSRLDYRCRLNRQRVLVRTCFFGHSRVQLQIAYSGSSTSINLYTANSLLCILCFSTQTVHRTLRFGNEYFHVLHRALKPEMNHSDTDNPLPLPAITSITSDNVNQDHPAPPRCPIFREFDPRGATTVPITIPSHTQQTTVVLLPPDDPQAANSKTQSRPCLPMTPDCLTQPLSRRTLRYIRRNARRVADNEPSLSADGRSKTIIYTVEASTYNTLDFPAQIPVPKLEDAHENNRGPPEPVSNSHTPRELPAPPSPPQTNPRRTKNKMPFPKNITSISAEQPTSPLATARTDLATISPSAPLLLRAAAHPGRDRARNQRPSPPVASSLAAPPAHTGAFAPFWDTISAETKRKMLGVTFHDVKRSVETAKAEAAATAIALADAEHDEKYDVLVVDKTHITAAFNLMFPIKHGQHNLWRCYDAARRCLARRDGTVGVNGTMVSSLGMVCEMVAVAIGPYALRNYL